MPCSTDGLYPSRKAQIAAHSAEGATLICKLITLAIDNRDIESSYLLDNLLVWYIEHRELDLQFSISDAEKIEIQRTIDSAKSLIKSRLGK
jgi:hypothetical protein